MLWYFELLTEFTLVLWLAFHRDGRPRFEAMLWADFVTGLLQCIFTRVHWLGDAGRIWYIGVIVEAPLMALALTEAADYIPLYHRRILFWWVSVTYACAWVRIFPFTSTALLLFNLLAFAVWLGHAVSSGTEATYNG